MRKRLTKKQLISLKLKAAIIDLNHNLSAENGLSYRTTIRRICPIETELVTIKRLNNKIKFEVREKEPHHNEPHFHIIIRGEGSGSYRISDFSAIEFSNEADARTV